MPKNTIIKAKSLTDTGKQMRWVVSNYHSDVAFMDGWYIEDVFRHIADLPYIEDPSDAEYLSRPSISLSEGAEFRDCDDKHIILGSHLYRLGIPFWFVAVSEKPFEDFHHVVIELAQPLNGIKYLDCTYSENTIYETKKFYKKMRM